MRKKKIPVFFFVYLAIFGEKYVSGLSKKLPLKCLKPHIFSGGFAPLSPLPGRCPGPNGGLRRPPYGTLAQVFLDLIGHWPIKSIFQIYP